MISPMSLDKFLGFIDIGYEKVPEGSELYDEQGTYELENDDDEEFYGTSIYPTIPAVVDRVSSIWYDWIDEDLGYAFGCEEDFHGDFAEMLRWIEDNKEDICAEDPDTYDVYTRALQCILNPDLVI